MPFHIPHIDYCNSLLCDLPKYSLHHLQKAQFSVARIVTRTFHSSHTTPILKSLHDYLLNIILTFDFFV